jgi:protein-S-isoprenylcysteine O-methyltransferase Ste14
MVRRLLVATVLWYGALGALLFASAGSLEWAAGWQWLAVMILLSLAIGIRLANEDPGLLKERLSSPIQNKQPFVDKAILSLVLVMIFAALAFMAADAARFRWSAMPDEVRIAGVVLLLLGNALGYWTMRTNSFAAPVVKLQDERGQRAITTGPYRIVRHPFYLGALFFIAGSSLLLGSWWGLGFVLPIGLLLALRIAFEEKFLRRNLAGYADYIERVHYRLIPLVW